MKVRLSISAIIVFLAFSAIGGWAQNAYTIFSVKGDVTISNHSGERTAVKRDTLKLSDYVKLAKGGSIRILESATGIIYTCEEKGVHKVKFIIDEGAAESKTIIGAVNSQLFEERNIGKSDNKGILGASFRGDHTDAALDSAAARFLTLASSGVVKPVVQPNEDGICNLTLDNTSKDILTVAVFVYNKENKTLRPALPDYIFCKPGATGLSKPELIVSDNLEILAAPVEETYYLPDLAAALLRKIAATP